MASNHVRVVAVFSLAYFVSYLFRGVNLGFAPLLSQEFGLSAANLGALTSLYFLGFAGAQIPAGALIFGIAPSFGPMMAGRLLIGVGVSACLGGAFKATARHFSADRLTLI